ncbi:MAG: DUF3306 domain-containing protein [Rhodobacter sp.]|nr:DUF3306 domain-containing protein [Rhodobacter sp.]
MSRDDSTMFDRWSERKRAAAAEQAEQPAPVDAAPVVADPAQTEEEILEQLGLPDPDTLGEGDDFTAYLKTGIPEFLRKRALRRLWRTNPVLANVDGLVEYGEDYTDAAMVPAVVSTLYQVGKGMLRKVAEPEPEAAPGETAGICLVAESDAATTQAAAPERKQAEIGAGGTDTAAESDPGDDVNLAGQPVEDEVETPVHRPGRMAFNYD